ncbi:hypothetical protein D3C80_2215540 [compost metagenome]
MMATRNDRPRVSGTNRKWYIAVRANCRRDSSTTVMSGMGAARQEVRAILDPCYCGKG